MKCKTCGYDAALTAAQVAERVMSYRKERRFFPRDLDVFMPKTDFVRISEAIVPHLLHPAIDNTPTLTMHDSFGRIRMWPYDGNTLVIGEVSQ
jgi:hypothetical protein